MRLDLRSDSVFERCYDLASCGVVFRIRRKHKDNVQRQPDRKALNLNVTLLHDIEKAHLDFARKIREFVDRKDPTVCSRKQSIVDGKLATKGVATLRRFDRINIADDVRNGYVRSRKLLDVTLVARTPHDRCSAALLVDQIPAL